MATTNDKLWQDWTDSFLEKRFPPHTKLMTHELSKVFLSLTMMESSGQDTSELEKDLSKDFMFNVIKKRADYYKLDYSIPALVLVVFLSGGRPGTGIMYVHAMKRLSQKRSLKINITVMAEAFPVGFPTDETLQALWDAQKGIGGAIDNYLDTVTLADGS